MFIKPYQKYNKTTKERYTVYKLCESYRMLNYIHHRIIISLGRLDELEPVEQKKLLASRIEDLIRNGNNTLPLSPIEENLEKLALHFYTEIKKKRRYDTFKPLKTRMPGK
jgi:hypothetical protein